MGSISIFIAVSLLQLQEEDFASIVYLHPFNSHQIVSMLQSSLPYHVRKVGYLF